jgi:hypothetical protein
MAAAAARAAGLRLAADQQRHGHVVERGKFGQQVMELVDEAERAVAQRAARRFAER